MHTMSYGSLTFAASGRHAIDEAFAYLSRDPVERSMIERLERSSVERRISINHVDNDSWDPNTNIIHWDPHSALRTTQGGRQSPALGLGHEIDHALENTWTAEKLQLTPDRRFDSVEERRVILGSERHAALTLGEALRYDHSGSCYRVPGPTYR